MINILHNCWINPNGKIHKLTEIEFDNLSNDINSIHEEIGRKLYPNLEYPCDYMMKIGYVKVQYLITGKVKIFNYKELTQSQINTLDILGIEPC